MIYNRFTRRMFLRGLGGFALSIPVLPSLLPRQAEAQVVNRKMKFAMMNTSYGRNLDKWFNATTNLQISADQQYRYRTLSDITTEMSPVFSTNKWDAALRRKLAIIRGMDNMDTLDSHNSHFATTAATKSPDSELGFGYSIDAIIEESPTFNTKSDMIPALRIVPTGNPNDFWYSWSFTSSGVKGQVIPYHNVLSDVYRKYFTQTGINQLNARNQRMKSVTNLVYQEYQRTMSNRRIASTDKARLDNYMSLLSQVESRFSINNVQCNKLPSGFEIPKSNIEMFPDAETMYMAAFELEAAALACGMTRIVMQGLIHHTSSIGAELGSEPWHHNAHNPEDLKYNRTAVMNTKWHLDRVADFLKKLDSIMDVDGNTLLDNTIFLLGNDDSSGGHWNLDMPVLMAGGKGRIRTDLYIDYRNPNFRSRDGYQWPLGRPYNSFLITAMKAMGLSESDYTKFPNQIGFGNYTGHNPEHTMHYQPYLSAAARNVPLPYLSLFT